MVGDGLSIKIGNDYWLVGYKFMLLASSSSLIQIPNLVAELINPATCRWDVEKIQNLLPPVPTAIVLKLGLSNEHRADKLI